MEQYKYDVFISYSRKDTETTNKIIQAFDANGITYFIDRQGIGGGMEFPAVLSQAIKDSKVFLFLASQNSYESKFTQSEIVYAFNKKDKKDIIPYIIDGSSLPDELEFTFSSINWRRIEQHPIETTLVNDILLKVGKTSLLGGLPSNNPDVSSASKKHVFTGKLLAQIILGIAIVVVIGTIVVSIANRSFIIDNKKAFDNILYSLWFILLLFLLIGYIRPKSLDLKSRKDVTRYYLTASALIFIASLITTADAKPIQSSVNDNIEIPINQ